MHASDFNLWSLCVHVWSYIMILRSVSSAAMDVDGFLFVFVPPQMKYWCLTALLYLTAEWAVVAALMKSPFVGHKGCWGKKEKHCSRYDCDLYLFLFQVVVYIMKMIIFSLCRIFGDIWWWKMHLFVASPSFHAVLYLANSCVVCLSFFHHDVPEPWTPADAAQPHSLMWV